MGTNYYLTTAAPCECCGRKYEDLHIGKSSMGWCFSLHVIPEQGITSLEDWIVLFRKDGAIITNEYGGSVSVEEMLDTIQNRKRPDFDWDDGDWWRGSYRSEADFHRFNYSRRGPNGLLRHAIDGHHCVAHGEGSWDCIVGDFS